MESTVYSVAISELFIQMRSIVAGKQRARMMNGVSEHARTPKHIYVNRIIDTAKNVLRTILGLDGKKNKSIKAWPKEGAFI